MGGLSFLPDRPMRWAAGLLAVVLTGCTGVSEPPRDLLLLTLDTLRWDALGSGGAAAAASPTLDRLARGGVQFSRAYTAIPITNSSHATILTGTWPATHGCRDFGGAWSRDVTTMAELLRPSKFQTAAFVAGYPLQREISRLDRGFDRYDDGWLADPAVAERSAEETVDAAIRYLESGQAGPRLFLWVHLFDPHKPYSPPDEMGRRYIPGYVKRPSTGVQEQPLQLIGLGEESPTTGVEPVPPDLASSLGRYAGEVAYLDREVRRLLEAFQRHRGLDRTLVAAVADHGESFEHGYYYRHIHHLYESLIRVPLILNGPGLPDGRILAEPIRTVDLLPTLTELLGVSSPPGVEGRSLVPAVRGRSRAEPPTIWAETPAGSPGRWGGPYVAVIQGAHKLIRSLGTGQEALFDLERDPGELVNRLDEPGLPLETLRHEMDRVLGSRGGDPSHGATPVLAPQAREKLQSLGYLQ